jgi:C-terminal processing protease CtpA/Prc
VTVGTDRGATFTLTRRAVDESFRGKNIGIRVEAGAGGLVVAEVAGPAARAGVKVGDVVVQLDGADASHFTPGAFAGASRGLGKRKLTVRRGAAPLDFEIPDEWFVVE